MIIKVGYERKMMVLGIILVLIIGMFGGEKSDEFPTNNGNNVDNGEPQVRPELEDIYAKI